MTFRRQHGDDSRVFLIAIAGTVFLGVFAIALGAVLGVSVPGQIIFSVNDLLFAVIATLPPVLFLWWFSKTTNGQLQEFRRSQIKFFAEIGFNFTLPRIVVMAIGAGVAEEMLFRGFLQTWLVQFTPLIGALFISNLIFGLLHMRTALYAIIAGCVGLYLGIIFALSGNLLVPIITHGLYDFAALLYTRRAIAEYRRANGNENFV